MKMPQEVDEMQWPSWSLVFENLRLSWEVFKTKLLKHPKASRRLNAESRSCNSNKMKITKIKNICLIWRVNFNKKIRTYKKQIEEAEEIAALNLAKYRKAQQELEEADERTKLAGSMLQTAVY